MKKKSALAFLPIVAILLLLMSVPKGSAEKIRGASIAMLSPLWEWLRPSANLPAELINGSKLQIENVHLRNELQRSQKILKELMQANIGLQRTIGIATSHATHSRLLDDLKQLHTQKGQAIVADVIYRAPSSWNSSLWINVGNSHNRSLEKPVVMLNSPVVVGQSLVGMIDYVGANQSRVRLITDSGLCPSVRAVRGSLCQQRVADAIETLSEQLRGRDGLFVNDSEREQFYQQLANLKKGCNGSQDVLYLAKGELHGSSAPLWRSDRFHLKGIGFNYDFADDYGAARDLRFGTPYGSNHSCSTSIPLVKEHDLLVTTGMDGVFPAGLHVAEVTAVHPLQEGDYYYQLEAMPTAGNMDNLSVVFVLPSSGFQLFN